MYNVPIILAVLPSVKTNYAVTVGDDVFESGVLDLSEEYALLDRKNALQGERDEVFERRLRGSITDIALRYDVMDMVVIGVSAVDEHADPNLAAICSAVWRGAWDANLQCKKLYMTSRQEVRTVQVFSWSKDSGFKDFIPRPTTVVTDAMMTIEIGHQSSRVFADRFHRLKEPDDWYYGDSLADEADDNS